MREDESGGHRLSARAQARRDGILDAALAVISHKGFHRASIADVAEVPTGEVRLSKIVGAGGYHDIDKCLAYSGPISVDAPHP